MKKLTQKIISAIIVVTMVLGFTILEVSASESGTLNDNIVWKFDESTATLTLSGTGEMPDFSSGSGYPWYGLRNSAKRLIIEEGVTNIGDNAFVNFNQLTKIFVPDGLKTIGESAFNNCSNLKDVELGKDIKQINNYAFTMCGSLEKIVLPENVEKLGEAVFSQCTSLTEITFPDSVTEIGSMICQFCSSLETINIGSGVKSVNNILFRGCTKIKNITVSDNNQNLSADEYGVLFNKDKTELLIYPSASEITVYAIPETVVSIYNGAFNFANNLTVIYVPNELTQIGANAFFGCTNLEKIAIPKNASQIGSLAFGSCEKLKNTAIPTKLETISSQSFDSCSELQTLYIPVNLKAIESYSFYNCNKIANIYYEGTQEDWDKIEINSAQNGSLLNANIYYNHSHLFTVETLYEASCTENGMNEYSCICGYSYYEKILSSGHAESVWEYKSDNEYVKKCDSCKEEYDSKTVEISLSASEIELEVLSSKQIEFSVTDDITSDLIFNSSNESVATIDAFGNIDALNVGETTVSITIRNTEISTACKVKVIPQPDKTIESENYDVSATFSPGCFDENVSLDINETNTSHDPGGIYMIDGKTYRQIGIYTIKIVDKNGNAIQPNEGYSVTVRIPVPNEYNARNNYIINHRFIDGGRERFSTSDGTLSVADGYFVFEVDKFSDFDIAVEIPSVSISELPNKLFYNYKESIDLKGIELKVVSPDGTVEYITDDSLIEVTSFDSTKIGKQTVTLTYNEYIINYDIQISYSWWQIIIRIFLLGFIWY